MITSNEAVFKICYWIIVIQGKNVFNYSVIIFITCYRKASANILDDQGDPGKLPKFV